MLLLSTISAYDLGYGGPLWAIMRIRNTVDTLERMERYRGHFLNWYDTSNLDPLLPRYVSTVDSGNLLGALFVVRRYCAEVMTRPPVDRQMWDGLADTLDVLREVIHRAVQRVGILLGSDLTAALDAARALLAQARTQDFDWYSSIKRLHEHDLPCIDEQLLSVVGGLSEIDPPLLAELRMWVTALHQEVERWQRTFEFFLPWRPILESAPAGLSGLPLFKPLKEALAGEFTVRDLPGRCTAARTGLTAFDAALSNSLADIESIGAAREWSRELGNALEATIQAVRFLDENVGYVAQRVGSLISSMDFSLLYDRQQRIFHIGFDVTAARIDEHHYDLLASEARLASFLAIAKGDVPQEHWLHLGRPIGSVKGKRTLLSWSGTMFEYLMPEIIMREEPGTLLERSCATAVAAQIDDGKRHAVPWGVSESGYYRFDQHQNYQYRAFGVPALGFKRGLEDELVIAPYASLLAVRYDARAVVANLQRLQETGASGRYGLYEAVDFSKSRLPAGVEQAVVRSFMSHHQGMILTALANYLLDDPLVRRFHSDPTVKTAELLLFERPADRAPIESAQPKSVDLAATDRRHLSMSPWEPDPASVLPQIHILSNGRYTLGVTDSGGGFSSWQGVALTRWSPDPTLENCGQQTYIRDLANDQAWSLTRNYRSAFANRRAVFHPHLAELQATEQGISAAMRIGVGAGGDVEIRVLTLTNQQRRRRTVRVSSYGEVVLDDPNAFRRHPAFSRLFVESEYFPDRRALVFHRRARSPNERSLYLMHMLVLPTSGATASGWKNERGSFLGRGGSHFLPTGFLTDRPLWSGIKGASLDPIMALAADVDLPTQRPRQLAWVTAAADSRDGVFEIMDRFHSF
ncbi:MAG TPA: glucoamylase family protein, partial [Candidatus Acidoferrales bacterium]|nr:glucoamylase family protein [Candidatus Acidoferrales bacterium]